MQTNIGEYGRNPGQGCLLLHQSLDVREGRERQDLGPRERLGDNLRRLLTGHDHASHLPEQPTQPPSVIHLPHQDQPNCGYLTPKQPERINKQLDILLRRNSPHEEHNTIVARDAIPGPEPMPRIRFRFLSGQATGNDKDPILAHRKRETAQH
ncbi:hypothetical protein OG496_31195 [Streptomyces sp. NBC_00988]|nr:hypothetical protein OG496_31195 [Streptomyces sp. NBC_00988]